MSAVPAPVETHPKTWEEYRDAWAKAERRELLTKHPLHLDMEFSGNCDLKCSMCWQSGEIGTPLGLMKDRLFKQVIDAGVRHGLAAVKLQSRGESLLHPRIADLARYAKEAGVMDVQLTTNGMLLAKGDKMDRLLASGIDKIIFSIDDAHDKSAAEIYGDRAPDIREVVRETLERRGKLAPEGPKIRIQTFAPPGQTQEERLKEVRAEFPGADEHLINVLWNSNVSEDSLNGLSSDFDLLPCPYLWTRLAVFWNGDVTLCCRDYNCSLNLGNANETDIREIWTGKEMAELRQAHNENRRSEISLCRHCDQATRRKGTAGKPNTFLHVVNG